jgi:hypothetical protein
MSRAERAAVDQARAARRGVGRAASASGMRSCYSVTITQRLTETCHVTNEASTGVSSR